MRTGNIPKRALCRLGLLEVVLLALERLSATRTFWFVGSLWIAVVTHKILWVTTAIQREPGRLEPRLSLFTPMNGYKAAIQAGLKSGIPPTTSEGETE